MFASWIGTFANFGEYGLVCEVMGVFFLKRWTVYLLFNLICNLVRLRKNWTKRMAGGATWLLLHRWPLLVQIAGRIWALLRSNFRSVVQVIQLSRGLSVQVSCATQSHIAHMLHNDFQVSEIGYRSLFDQPTRVRVQGAFCCFDKAGLVL